MVPSKKASGTIELPDAKIYCIALTVDEDTFQKLQQISAQGIKDLKADLETALKSRVAVFAAAQEYALNNLAMQ